MKKLTNSFFGERTTYLKKSITYSDFLINPYKTVQMDYFSDEHIEYWCNIVNQAYKDVCYSDINARVFLQNHPFCDGNNTALVFLENKAIATISYGKIKKNSNIGSFFRIAVLPSYQNCGIGKMLISIAESEMIKQGIKEIEESISLKRFSSFSMHFKAGYKPEIFSFQRRIRRSVIKEIALAVCGYNMIINIITWKRYFKYKQHCIKKA